ncbi:MAG TPA: CDP-diacylglycerol--serine O-phosphatidyltransferase [Syntrophales bacterium]|nr:CDP-diacylglycerol--serine O-phosphatidyltransferase [Syntrophales bacterium]
MKSDTIPRRSQRKRGVYLLPNILTTASLFCGFYSILASVKEDFSLAASVIVYAVVLDGLDGRIARMTNTMSKFGAEYDSLADLITFGVAPSILAYSWALSGYGKWGWLVSFLFVVCGALRLARFNIQIGLAESRVFNGLPIPGAASVIATGIILYYYIGGTGKFHDLSVMVATIALALLMVSNVKYYSFKDLNFFSRKPFMSFVLVIIIMIIVAAEPQITLFTFALVYVFSGPIWWYVKGFKKATNKKNEERLKIDNTRQGNEV